jgi:hypothetical protein
MAKGGKIRSSGGSIGSGGTGGNGGIGGSGIFGHFGTTVLCKAEDNSSYCKLMKVVNAIMAMFIILAAIFLVYTAVMFLYRMTKKR